MQPPAACRCLSSWPDWEPGSKRTGVSNVQVASGVQRDACGPADARGCAGASVAAEASCAAARHCGDDALAVHAADAVVACGGDGGSRLRPAVSITSRRGEGTQAARPCITDDSKDTVQASAVQARRTAPVSAMYRLPEASTATAVQLLSLAAVARPPSPL